MDINYFIDIFLHLDQHLFSLLSQYNLLAYVLIFVIIFIETGLVVTPFLPGDSLLFAVGAIAAAGGPVNIPIMLALLYIAAISGDSVNYQIGHMLRDKVQRKEKMRFIKHEYIEKTQEFFEKHGGKTVTIARFIPIIRTFAPFVAGASKMHYRYFLKYNVIGGVLWVSLLFSIGYFFGNIPFIKTHFGFVVIGIIVISVLPAVYEIAKEMWLKRGRVPKNNKA